MVDRVGQRAVEAELAELRALVAVVTHDLANAVGVVGNYSTLLSRTAADATVTDVLRRIRESADDATRLARGLAAAADPSLPEAPATDLRAVVDGSLSRRPAGVAAVTFRSAAGPVPVLGSAAALGLVVDALLANAAEACGPEATVTVRLDDSDSPAGVHLVVEDTGSGLDAATSARLFTPFASARDEHHGIGLTVARRIVEGAGGRLRVDSDGRGLGTTVTVILPGAAGDHG